MPIAPSPACARRSNGTRLLRSRGPVGSSTHTFTNYVKVAFFRGTSLRPVPPGQSKHKEVRYLDIRKDDELDEEQMTTWIRQAAALPGWVP